MQGVYYDLAYDNNCYPGKATVKVIGKGNYTGTKLLDFYIAPENVSITSIHSYEKGSIYLDVACDGWLGYDGVQVVYSTDSKFMKKKAVDYSYSDISHLTSGKTYYVKIRAYIVVCGKRIYGNYSKVKKVKVK